MTRRMQQFSGRQIAGAYAKALLHMAWLWLKGLNWAERLIYGSLIALPLLYLVIFITGG